MDLYWIQFHAGARAFRLHINVGTASDIADGIVRIIIAVRIRIRMFVGEGVKRRHGNSMQAFVCLLNQQ